MFSYHPYFKQRDIKRNERILHGYRDIGVYLINNMCDCYNNFCTNITEKNNHQLLIYIR